jgi:uncharacterized damage-inducible protein DinB
MEIQEAFIAELKHECALTRKMLERVPMDKKDWKPHEKSMSLGRVATHLSDTIKWASVISNSEVFDFATVKSFGFVAASYSDLMQLFDTALVNAIADLSKMTDDDFEKVWEVRRGEQVMFSTHKKAAIRGWVISHMIHHRGQLSVYLRLLDVPVPGMYGPSADERM